MVINWCNGDIMTWNLQSFQPFYLKIGICSILFIYYSKLSSVLQDLTSCLQNLWSRSGWDGTGSVTSNYYQPLLELTELSVHFTWNGKCKEENTPRSDTQAAAGVKLISLDNILFSQCFFRVKSTELDVCQNELKKIKYENGITESR